MLETIVFDVGETITRDDRYWARWADCMRPMPRAEVAARLRRHAQTTPRGAPEGSHGPGLTPTLTVTKLLGGARP